jgi:hypothetical protein
MSDEMPYEGPATLDDVSAILGNIEMAVDAIQTELGNIWDQHGLVGAVADHLSEIKNDTDRLDKIADMLGNIANRLVDSDFGKIESRLDSIDRNLDFIEKKFFGTDLTKTELSISSIERSVDKTELSISHIERSVDEIKRSGDKTDVGVIPAGIFLVIFLLIAAWPGSTLDRWTDKVWYSFRYDADFDQMTVNKRPLDCDFSYAPIGKKGCDYKKRANIFGAEQRQELIRQATTDHERQEYTNRPNSVSVYWEKEQD